MCSANWSAVLPPGRCGTMLLSHSSTSMAAGCTAIFWEKRRPVERLGGCDDAVCEDPARLCCNRWSDGAARTCGARHRQAEADDRDLLRERLPEARRALQRHPRPS